MVKAKLIGGLLCLALVSCIHKPSLPTSETISLIAGGDVMWTQRVRLPDYYFGSEDKSNIYSEDGWRRLPYAATPQSKVLLEDVYKRAFETDETHFKRAIQFDLTFESEQARLDYPFEKMGDWLSRADITFVNLETPLSNDGRLSGAFRMPESFANTLKNTGIDIVSTANNHAFDAEGEGISDTLNALAKAGIVAVGTGENLNEAMEAKILTIKGRTFAFLAFTYGVNPTATSLGFATNERSGAAPLDPLLIKQAIKDIRDDADFVIVSLHWGLENKAEVHPAARQLAHDIIDNGADIILGHHPHIPRGVETYKGGLIAYSLGNFIFGHNHDNWEDNFLLEIIFDKNAIKHANIIPIAGRGQDIAQPYILSGPHAQMVLETIKQRSAVLGTKLDIQENIGVIRVKP